MKAESVVMGIVNVTPDSFSNDGLYGSSEAAIAQGLQQFSQGAAIVDVGGESTRPGALSVPLDEELRRVVDVVAGLAPHGRVSIDTTKEQVAVAAAEAGACILNDVSANLCEVAAQLGMTWIAVHRQGTAATMQDNPTYGDVVVEVAEFLVGALQRGVVAGVKEVWVDPGIGFGKTTAHNLELLANVRGLSELGAPLVVGASRKRFIGELHARSDAIANMDANDLGVQVPADDRLEGSLAVATWAFSEGASVVRTHDVAFTLDALRVVGGKEAVTI